MQLSSKCHPSLPTSQDMQYCTKYAVDEWVLIHILLTHSFTALPFVMALVYWEMIDVA